MILNLDGIKITKKLILHLLSKMKLFDEWGKAIVLELFSKFSPEEKDIVTILVISILILIDLSLY